MEKEPILLDKTDRLLLDLMQQDFPLSADPWFQIGHQLELAEEEVLARVKRLKEAGIIRRIGGVLDSRKLGFVSCLCAMRVPKERMEEVAMTISRHPGVTHNYQREGMYNLWFTLTVPSKEEQQQQLKRWEHELMLPIFPFHAEKTFKRKVQFSMRQAGENR